MSHTLDCRSGNHFSPSLVRVGLKVHHSVEKLALDTIVRARLAASATVRPTGRARHSPVNISLNYFLDSGLGLC